MFPSAKISNLTAFTSVKVLKLTLSLSENLKSQNVLRDISNLIMFLVVKPHVAYNPAENFPASQSAFSTRLGIATNPPASPTWSGDKPFKQGTSLGCGSDSWKYFTDPQCWGRNGTHVKKMKMFPRSTTGQASAL
jgi:hypothetical protein